MEFTMKIHALLAVLLLAAGGSAMAQAPAPKDPLATPRIDARQANQEKRIQQGVASGQLTPREASRLEKGEARIEKAEARAKADGVVTGQERKHLLNMENRESQAIYKEKHDKQRDLNHDGKKDHPQGVRHDGGKQGGHNK
jgi:hypothetical protein